MFGNRDTALLIRSLSPSGFQVQCTCHGEVLASRERPPAAVIKGAPMTPLAAKMKGWMATLSCAMMRPKVCGNDVGNAPFTIHRKVARILKQRHRMVDDPRPTRIIKFTLELEGCQKITELGAIRAKAVGNGYNRIACVVVRGRARCQNVD